MPTVTLGPGLSYGRVWFQDYARPKNIRIVLTFVPRCYELKEEGVED